MSDKLQKRFPAILKKFMAAAKKFFKRSNALPLEVKRVLATIVYLNYRLRHRGEMNYEARFDFIANHVAGLPEAVKEELDKVFPRMSEIKVPDPDELEKINAKAKNAIACEDPTVNKCGVYKRVMKTGNLEDAIQFI
uniref:DUF4065 domain-containing protein n=1 Tax=Steinernema glaseri TaxID=37863 RepID=A0A1I8ARG1_9BILA